MNGRWLLMGVVCLAVALPAHAGPEEMTAKERTQLEEKANKLNEELVQLYIQGNLGEALIRARRALAIRRNLYPAKDFPQGHPDLATSLDNLGSLLEAVRQDKEALEHLQQALAMRELLYPVKEYPQGHKDLALSLSRMGKLLMSMGRQEKALDYLQQSLIGYQKLYPTKEFPQGHPDLARIQNDLGILLQSMGRLEGGLEHFQKSLAMYKKVYPANKFPQGHPDLANSLISVATMLQSMGRLEDALEHHQQALTMLRKLYPETQYPQGHPDLALCLNNLASAFHSMGRNEEALDCFQQGLIIHQKLYPTKQFPLGHPDLATSLINMGLVLISLDRFDLALEYYQKALAMLRRLYPEKQFPNGNLILANCLKNLGNLLQAMDHLEDTLENHQKAHAMGRLENALEHNQKALAMFRKLYPAKHYPQGHVDLAMSLNSTGSVLHSLGKLKEGLEYHQQALAMLQKLYPANQFPNGHPALAQCYTEMGSVLKSFGQLNGSIEYLKEALATYHKLYPKTRFPHGHPDLAMGLNTMGMVHISLGRFENALDYFQQTLAIREKLYPAKQFPQGSWTLAESLNNVAGALQSLGRLEDALKYSQRSLAMTRNLYPENQFPQGHWRLAQSLNNVGLLMHRLGRMEAAMEHLQQALAMQEKLYPTKEFPQGHSKLAMSLMHVGYVLQSMGRLEEALEHYHQTLAMYQKLFPTKLFPEGNPQLASCLSNLGGVLLASRRYEEAKAALEKALAMERGLANRFALDVSESEALAYNQVIHSSLALYLSATQKLPRSTPATYARVWIDRAPLNRILLQRHQTALAAASNNLEVRKHFDRLQETRRDLAGLLLQPLPVSPEALRNRDDRVNELTETKQRLERDLTRLMPELVQQPVVDTVGYEDLRKALPSDAVFVDVLRYDRVEFDPKKPGRRGEKWIHTYVAFVVRPDTEVQRVELGEAKPIEEALADFLHLIEERREQDNPKAAATLRRLVWDPIAEKLPRETHTVYLTPDGDLTHLPWAALPGTKKATILLEDYALALVPHGPFLLDQLRSERRFGQGKGTSLALGGVRYSDIPNLGTDVLAQAGPDREGTKESWSYLEGTERELKLLQKLAGKDTLALEGKDASVPRLLSTLPNARLAHLATHGFFNQKEYRLEKLRAQKQTIELLQSADLMSDRTGRRITAGAQNPLAYTGLVLAGANVPDKAGPSGGILTGESIVDLDLRKLELAVLSACQTGLGEAENGECVHNLQIAFHVAGCANVAASLWNVPDESTAALMGLFYRYLLVDGKTPVEALRSAQLYLYRHPGQIKQLAERAPLVAKGVKGPEPEVKPDTQVPAEGKRAAVKDWAAFVMSGVGR